MLGHASEAMTLDRCAWPSRGPSVDCADRVIAPLGGSAGGKRPTPPPRVPLRPHSDAGFATAATIVVTVVAGPLDHLGLDPQPNCELPLPSE